MIYRSDSYKEKMNMLEKGNFEIVMDYDRTVTRGDSNTTWGILSSTNILPPEYRSDRMGIFNYYRPIEVDSHIDEMIKMVAMDDWYHKHIELLKKYRLNKKQIIDLFKEPDTMILRDGFIEFYKYLNDKDISIQIISAGIANFIEEFLKKNKCLSDNVIIKGNYLDFDEEGIVRGIKGTCVHSLNKNEIAYQVIDKKYVIVIGDQVSDIRMVEGIDRRKVIAIGFINKDNIGDLEEFKDFFDMVLTDDESFQVILDDLKNGIDK